MVGYTTGSSFEGSINFYSESESVLHAINASLALSLDLKKVNGGFDMGFRNAVKKLVGKPHKRANFIRLVV